MNVVYIMCEDHSYQTISAYDQRYMQTPNIDRIANEGVRFTNSFVANSLSGPSRACMLTGKHSHANGFTDNTTTFDGNQQTFPKLLQANGYQTAMIGKWHLVSEHTGELVGLERGGGHRQHQQRKPAEYQHQRRPRVEHLHHHRRKPGEPGTSRQTHRPAPPDSHRLRR